MDDRQCKDCLYFRQHDTVDDKRIFRVYCGHCTQGRIKKKKPDTKACEYFVYAPPVEDFFVTKEYLSKELLRRVLDMELMPEIEELPPMESIKRAG